MQSLSNFPSIGTLAAVFVVLQRLLA